MKNTTKAVDKDNPKEENGEIEKCVICGADTPFKASTPLAQRIYYIDGAGQLCKRCYYEIFTNLVI